LYLFIYPQLLETVSAGLHIYQEYTNTENMNLQILYLYSYGYTILKCISI